jgi:hypothetical protein
MADIGGMTEQEKKLGQQMTKYTSQTCFGRMAPTARIAPRTRKGEARRRRQNYKLSFAAI